MLIAVTFSLYKIIYKKMFSQLWKFHIKYHYFRLEPKFVPLLYSISVCVRVNEVLPNISADVGEEEEKGMADPKVESKLFPLF